MRTRIFPQVFLSSFALLLAVAQGQEEQQHIFEAPTSDTRGILRRFTPETPESLSEIIRLAESHDLDIWQIANGDTPHVDIYSPKSSPALPSTLLAAAPHSIRGSNISLTVPRIRAKEKGEWGLSSLANTTFHTEYHPQSEVDSFMAEMARLHPDQVKIVQLGHTGEGRETLGMKISSSVKSDKSKLGIVVLGPQHAREWVATSTALYIAHALLTNSSEPNSLAHLLEVYNFHIIPSPNPDGYVYTWEHDRLWYKNRQIVGPGAKCIGIDMNRNWGFHWKPHADNPLFVPDKKNKKNKEPADPCSHWYPGHRAFEAYEVNNLANYVTAINGVGKGAGKGGIVAFLDLRSYGQMLAAPYSYTCDQMPKDAEDQIEALLGAAQAARGVYGTPFTIGSLCHLLYRAPGNILDYVYRTASIKYTYAAFLRDTGTYGFALPPEWIRPVGEETGVLVDYLAKFIARQRGIEI